MYFSLSCNAVRVICGQEESTLFRHCKSQTFDQQKSARQLAEPTKLTSDSVSITFMTTESGMN